MNFCWVIQTEVTSQQLHSFDFKYIRWLFCMIKRNAVKYTPRPRPHCCKYLTVQVRVQLLKIFFFHHFMNILKKWRLQGEFNLISITNVIIYIYPIIYQHWFLNFQDIDDINLYYRLHNYLARIVPMRSLTMWFS